MKSRLVDPLQHGVQIVDPSGRPTPLFSRLWMQMRGVDEALGTATDSLDGLETGFAEHAASTAGVHGIVDTAALVVTTDPRMTNARTPTAHNHDDRYYTETEINAALASYATGADLAAHASGTTGVHGIADTSALVLTTDPRMTNARAPTAHTHATTDLTGTLTKPQQYAQTAYTDAANSFASATQTFNEIVALKMRAATADGSDNSSVSIGGGGNTGVTRGATAAFFGNEVVSTGGQVQIFGGGVSSGNIRFYVGVTSTERLTLSASDGSATFGGQIKTAASGISLAALTASTAPFTGVPATALVVTNFDADKLDGQHGTYFLARANHTGTQAAATITGLATVATSGLASDLTGTLADARLSTNVAKYNGTGTFFGAVSGVSAGVQVGLIGGGGGIRMDAPATDGWQIYNSGGSLYFENDGGALLELSAAGFFSGIAEVVTDALLVTGDGSIGTGATPASGETAFLVRVNKAGVTTTTRVKAAMVPPVGAYILYT